MSDKDNKKAIIIPANPLNKEKGTLPAHPPNKERVLLPDKSGKLEVTLKSILRGVPLPPQKTKDEGLASEIRDWTKWVKENPQQASRLIKEWFDVEEK
ncbi:MAG: hypothetical protein HQK89_02030 [Nitrospirae bacterium]|nr:hypothetical protein [Nitrospirota bacterium]